VIDIQRIAHDAALGLHGDFLGTHDREERARVASAISNLGKAWCSLQDAKREILGKPKAGVFKPEHPKPKRKPYWEMMPQPIFEEPPGEAQLEQNKAAADEVKWEMREGPPGVLTQVVTDSPAIRAAAAAQAGLPSIPQQPQKPPPSSDPANDTALATKPAPVRQSAQPSASQARLPGKPVPSPIIVREPPVPPGAVRRQLVHGPDGRPVWKLTAP
jgi:hypothetical protein